MPKMLAFFIISILFTGCAGMQPLSQPPTAIEFIKEAEGISKDALFSSSKAWIAENFKSSKAVIEDADKDAGRIIGNGTAELRCAGDAWSCMALRGKLLGFTFRVDTKDGKFKTTYSNLRIITMPTPGSLVGFVYSQGKSYSEEQVTLKAEVEAANHTLEKVTARLADFVIAARTKATW